MADEGLEIEITPVRASFHLGEPLLVRVCLFNFGEVEQVVNARLAASRPGGPGELSFDLVGPSGRSLPFTARVNVGRPHAEDFFLLMPWSCVGKQHDLALYFTIEETGNYAVTATYSNAWPGEGEGAEAWQGMLRSNAASFELERTSGRMRSGLEGHGEGK